MQTITTVAAMQQAARRARQAGQRLGLVPTMGALHDGHLALVRHARAHADHVTVSLFVNPTQFGPGEDFSRYPRTPDADADRLREAGVDVLFMPSVEEMYPFGTDEGVWVKVEEMDAHLCGRHRPGHFRGVTTVVTKLFNACAPDVAVFGMKDAQQFFILQRMTRALQMPVELAGHPIEREADGLARSSRNVYLNADERAQAVVLFEALEDARKRIGQGEQDSEGLVGAMLRRIGTAPLARVQYAEVVDAHTLQPLERLETGQRVLVALAVYFGKTRLIDNLLLDVPASHLPSP